MKNLYQLGESAIVVTLVTAAASAGHVETGVAMSNGDRARIYPVTQAYGHRQHSQFMVLSRCTAAQPRSAQTGVGGGGYVRMPFSTPISSKPLPEEEGLQGCPVCFHAHFRTPPNARRVAGPPGAAQGAALPPHAPPHSAGPTQSLRRDMGPTHLRSPTLDGPSAEEAPAMSGAHRVPLCPSPSPWARGRGSGAQWPPKKRQITDAAQGPSTQWRPGALRDSLPRGHTASHAPRPLKGPTALRSWAPT